MSVAFSYAKIGFMRVGVDNIASYTYSIFVSKFKLEKQIEELEIEREVLRRQNDRLALYEQYAQLVQGASSSGQVIARVITRPPFTTYDTLLLSKGSGEGVSEGMVVTVASSTLPVGTVTEVLPHSSYVALFSYPDYRTEIEIGTSTSIFEAIGEGNGVFQAVIPKSLVVQQGDVIRMPRKALGTYSYVEYIRSNDVDPFTLIRFRLPLRFNQLDFVTLINP
jgi:cell shape-determining protein MreC